MANYTRKGKMNENVNINFNQSQEIAYWAKKYGVSPDLFKKTFEETGHSISKTLAACLSTTNAAAARRY